MPDRPKYRPLPGAGLVELPLYCEARGHLARFGTAELVGVTRGYLPMPTEARHPCGGCLAYYEALPPALRPADPLDV